MFDPRLISAELLKLRRRPGMLAIALLLTLGVSLVVYAVTGIQHSSAPLKHAPAGGAASYKDFVNFLSLMAMVVGVIIGGTAGTQDVETGVFRDLAATGRSRLALFGARATGAWLVVGTILVATMAATDVLSLVMTGSAQAPGAGMLVAGSAAVLVAGLLSSAMAVGISALVGSRGPVIGTLLAFFLAIQPLLAAIGLFGAAREGIPSVVIARIGDVAAPGNVQVALGVAIAAVLAWAAAALGLGAWKTRAREI
jgi:hypothetical protein